MMHTIDRARALGNLRWQRIGSGARDVRVQRMSSDGNGKASPSSDEPGRSSDKSTTCDSGSHRVATNGNNHAKRHKRVRFPPPPLCKSLKDKELPEQPFGLAAPGQRRPDAACQPLTLSGNSEMARVALHLAPAVLRIAEVWPQLPPHIRDAIATLIEASGCERPIRSNSECQTFAGETAWKIAQQCRSIVQGCLREEEWKDADKEFYNVILEALG